MAVPVIAVDGVTKRFGAVEAVKNTSLEIARNEFFALLGPSGCGKTTLLRMLAGFETPTTGRVLIDGEDVTEMPPNQRPVNMVFQSYAVFPHMTVSENVGYGLKVTGTPRDQIARAAAEALERVGLGDFGNRRPDQLSGGQRQRVALARALVKRPKVMLLDEPLSALDAKLREAMQMELSTLQADVGITFVMVTHDQDEALSMADRIAVMEGGAVAQIGDPADIYEAPKNRFVADFIGRVNLIDGAVVGGGDGHVLVDTVFGRMKVPHNGPAEGQVSLAIRPEKIRISSVEAPEGDVFGWGKIRQWAYYGDSSNVFVTLENGAELSVVLQNDTRDTVNATEIGQDVRVAWSASDTLILNG